MIHYSDCMPWDNLKRETSNMYVITCISHEFVWLLKVSWLRMKGFCKIIDRTDAEGYTCRTSMHDRYSITIKNTLLLIRVVFDEIFIYKYKVMMIISTNNRPAIRCVAPWNCSNIQTDNQYIVWPMCFVGAAIDIFFFIALRISAIN